MIEPFIQQAMLNQNSEKSFIDKVIANKDIESVRELIKKTNLTRDEIYELSYVLSNAEIKMVDFSPYERYVLMKYGVWVGESIKQLIGIYDYEDKLKSMNKSDVTEKLLNNCRVLSENIVKNMVTLFFMISRSSLSIDGKGIDKVLSTKFEVNYPQPDANIVKGEKK